MGLTQLTQSEITELLGISRTTLFRLIKEGLPFTETPNGKKYFDEDEVRNFLKTRKDNLLKELAVGKIYSNDEIVEIFRVPNMGAMRRSHSRNALVLITYQDGSDKLYNDYWQQDVLYYTSRGQYGNQELDGQKKTLAESNKNGITVYLFEKFTKGYQYRGIVKLVKKPFKAKELDSEGIERTVWKFPLKLINDRDYIDVRTIDEQECSLHPQIQREILNYLTKTSITKKTKELELPVSERTVKATRIQINPLIAEYVRMRANGVCELCGKRAPFEYNGQAYLMLSHIIPPSMGGKDAANNVVALCPNCNARYAMIGTKEDQEKLKSIMKKNEIDLQRKLNGEE